MISKRRLRVELLGAFGDVAVELGRGVRSHVAIHKHSRRNQLAANIARIFHFVHLQDVLLKIALERANFAARWARIVAFLVHSRAMLVEFDLRAEHFTAIARVLLHHL